MLDRTGDRHNVAADVHGTRFGDQRVPRKAVMLSMVQWNISLELAAVPLVGFVTPTQHGFIECKVPERTNTR